MVDTSIIVYRNPLEAAIWESMNFGSIFPIFAGGFAALIFIVLLNVIFSEIWGQFDRRMKYVANASLALGGVVWFLVSSWLWV